MIINDELDRRRFFQLAAAGAAASAAPASAAPSETKASLSAADT